MQTLKANFYFLFHRKFRENLRRIVEHFCFRYNYSTCVQCKYLSVIRTFSSQNDSSSVFFFFLYLTVIIELSCSCSSLIHKWPPTGSVNNLGTPCRLFPLPPFATLKRLENVSFSVRKASGLYNIERGKGYHPQRCQMSQELLSETV